MRDHLCLSIAPPFGILSGNVYRSLRTSPPCECGLRPLFDGRPREWTPPVSFPKGTSSLSNAFWTYTRSCTTRGSSYLTSLADRTFPISDSLVFTVVSSPTLGLVPGNPRSGSQERLPTDFTEATSNDLRKINWTLLGRRPGVRPQVSK